MNMLLGVRFRVFSEATFALIAVLLFQISVGTATAFADNEAIAFSENVNLALRRTAHQLLVFNGDSTSVIAPVQQEDANTFVVQLNPMFDYDKLPELLQRSLEIQGIKRGYNVAILNCENGTLQLGYNFKDLKTTDGVACRGRQQEPGCYQLKISFSPEPAKAAMSNGLWLLPFGGLLTVLGYMLWKKKKIYSPDLSIDADTEKQNLKIRFGNSALDMANLLLISGNSSYNLTYREAKLLNLFAGNVNQILERDYILKSVWEDEGIIVGRSVDVFVSRLRKMLSFDSQLKITAVHGIGYRMEVLS